MDRFIGKILAGRYEIIERIGSGGMANVYKARCNVLNRNVAVKILKEEYKNHQDFLKRFRTEAQAVALLSHNNIVSVFDVGSENDLPYIVMELIEGITLKEYITQKGALSWQESLLLITQILRALDHAHGRQIIHRDIKPQNIMLLRDGTIKVADFGIARFTVSNTQTITESAIGSAHYLSPEQAKGSITDEKSDIYAVGVVLYEMLTGKLPFDADNPVMVAVMHLQGNPPPPTSIIPSLPSSLESITMKAMAREGYKRYQNAQDMLSDINSVRKDPKVDLPFKYEYNPIQNTQFFEKIPSWAETGVHEPIRGSATYGGHDDNTQRQDSSRRQTKRSNPAQRRKKLIFAGIGAVLAIFLIVYMVSSIAEIIADLDDGTIGESGKVEYEVPSFLGENYEELLKDKELNEKFDIIKSDERHNELEAGLIISQNPVQGRKIVEGGKIEVVVSLGEKEVHVPDVVNSEYRAASIILNNLGFVVKTERVYHDTIINGYIIKTDPEFGRKLEEGATITVYVSQGKEIKTVKMPDVVGETIEDARKTILLAGLVIKEVNQIESEVQKGLVVTQSIAKDSEVAEKSEVTLEVSRGKIFSKVININLPLNPSAFLITVTVNGVEQYRETHFATEDQINVTLEGSGSCLVEIFVDDKLHASDIKTFG